MKLSSLITASTRLPLIGGLIRRALVEARYDSAFQGWGERSWLFQSLQDSWLEIDSMTRQELQRVHDALIENSCIVKKIRSLKIQFSVGAAGLKLIPESSDEGFNDARSQNWEAWWNAPELGCQTTGAQLTRVWAGLLFDKGEIFIHKTFAKIGNAKVPKLQTIDAHRVKTPSGKSSDDGTGFPIVDGVVINPATGERVAYYVKRCNYSQFIPASQGQSVEEFDRLDASNVIHKFKVLRPGQVRGVPEGASVFNLVRDNMDLHKMEMQAAKIACEIAVVENNPSGELDTYTSRKQKLNIQTQNAAGTPVTKNSNVNYNVSLGAKKIALRSGDSIKNFQIDRPTVVQMEYWDLHYTLICMGYNVPKLLVMPYSLQGTVTRADLDVCANAFREDFELIREICEDIYEWQGSWAIKSDLNLSGAKWLKAAKGESAVRAKASRWVQDAITPDDPHVCLIRPPRSPNVDIGYTAKALEIEMRLGIKVPQDVFADQGKDWRTQTRQMAEYLSYVNGLATEYGLQPGQITSLATQQVIEDPTNKPDQPEGAAPGGGESSPENRHRQPANA